MGQLEVADVAAQVTLNLETDFVDYREFKPQGYQEVRLHDLLEQVIAWAEALRPLRPVRCRVSVLPQRRVR